MDQNHLSTCSQLQNTHMQLPSGSDRLVHHQLLAGLFRPSTSGWVDLARGSLPVAVTQRISRHAGRSATSSELKCDTFSQPPANT
jgi:hypothetical protein